MTNPSISRRDWFRLRLSGSVPKDEDCDRQHAAEQLAAAQTTLNTESQRTLLSPVPAPPNHDGLDLSQLPPMREAVLDAQQLDALLADIHQFTSKITLMQRGKNPRAFASGPSTDTASIGLRLAGDSLKSGCVQRIQIRYVWNDASWIDTLERKTDGFRLVRIRHEGQ